MKKRNSRTKMGGATFEKKKTRNIQKIVEKSIQNGKKINNIQQQKNQTWIYKK
jgi:hypothetical protein